MTSADIPDFPEAAKLESFPVYAHISTFDRFNNPQPVYSKMYAVMSDPLREQYVEANRKISKNDVIMARTVPLATLPVVLGGRTGAGTTFITEDQDIRMALWASTHGVGTLPTTNKRFLKYSHRAGRWRGSPVLGEDEQRFYDGNIPLINHSCFPNAKLIHDWDKYKRGRVIALETIKPGKEITIRYGWNMWAVEKQYDFECECNLMCKARRSCTRGCENIKDFFKGSQARADRRQTRAQAQAAQAQAAQARAHQAQVQAREQARAEESPSSEGNH